MYYSQYKQDLILNEKYFKNKPNGIFLDVGAHDGISLSNTYFFEKNLNWTGICFEPIPSVFEKLKENRNSICVNSCVWKENGKKNFRIIDGYSEMLSGILESYDSRHMNRIENECQIHNLKYTDIEIDCITLNDILENHSIYEIDFMSIDTEGSELDIFESIDYDKFKIEYILVEDNYNNQNMHEFLVSKNYTLQEVISIDKLYKKNN